MQNSGKLARIRLLALCLGIIFLGAQFHFCSDLTPSATSTSHICPLCAATGVAVVAQSPVIAIVPAANRLEILPAINTVPFVFSSPSSPRAPPSV